MAIIVTRRKPVVPAEKNNGRFGAKFKRLASENMFNRAKMSRMDTVPRLGPAAEARAIAAFVKAKGVTKCPTMFVAPTLNAASCK